MLTLVNSMTYGAGSTTFAYFMAKTRSTLLSKPALIVSTQNSRPYRHMLPVVKDWENPSLKNVLTKLQTYTDIRTFCYKADQSLYYLNVEGVDIKTAEGAKMFLEFIRGVDKNAVHDGFESVWIDIDNSSGGFLKFADDVDLIVVPVPPNIIKLEDAAAKMAALRQEHVQSFGMQLKTPIYYCVQMYNSQLPLTEIKKILKVQDRFLLPFGYDVDIARQFNDGKLSFYISEVLSEPKTTEQKTINVQLRRMLKEIKPQRR